MACPALATEHPALTNRAQVAMLCPGQTPDTARRTSQARWKSKKSTFNKTFPTNYTSAEFGIHESWCSRKWPTGHFG